jgi:hypothetical protein
MWACMVRFLRLGAKPQKGGVAVTLEELEAFDTAFHQGKYPEQRWGQAFVNAFGIKSDPDLFYKENYSEAFKYALDTYVSNGSKVNAFFDYRPKAFVQHLERCAKRLCPDYPWSDKDDAFDYLWALTSSIEGTNAANKDCHGFIEVLRKRLGMSKDELFELWVKEKDSIMRATDEASSR